MSRTFHTEGIILKNYRFGEIHKGVVFISPEYGMMDAVAFGAYSAKGKLRSMTDPLCAGILYLYRDPVKDRIKITDMDCRSFFPGIRENVRKFFHASVFLETVLKTFGGEGPHVFRLLMDALTLLESIPEENLTRLLVQFLFRYLSFAGVAPQLDVCGMCGKVRSDRESMYVRPEGMEVFCNECSRPEDGILPAGGINYLLYTSSLSISAALSIQMEESSLQALKRFLLSSIQTLATGALQSVRTGEGFL
ncbi:MAG: hypothetical protein Kow009_09710 [Spirochaetales bacterium]